MLCVSKPPMFAYYFIAFADDAQWFGVSFCRTAITKITIMHFVYVVSVTEYDAADLFSPGRPQVLNDKDRLRTSRVLVPLPCRIRADTLKSRLFCITRDRTVDFLATVLVSTRAGKIGVTVPDCLGCFLFDFTEAKNILVHEWYATRFKQTRRGSTLPGAVRA